MARVEVSAAQRMTQLVVHIDRNLGERLTLFEMAAVLQLNPYHFAHVFKQATGLAPHQYLIRRRIARAKHFLESTDLPIAEIALAVGCANQSHFSALFHRVTGMTPLTCRVRSRPSSSPPPQLCDIPPANRRASSPDTTSASLRYTTCETAGKLASAGAFDTGDLGRQ